MFAAVPRRYQRYYDTYRLMRIFSLPHPDDVRRLPAHFADWALMFDRVEESVAEERERERMRAMWG
jgi:hypothetical protein